MIWVKNVFSYWNKPSRAAYLFVAPTMLLLFIFTIMPLFAAFVISMFDVNLFMNNPVFVGVGNFVEAFNNSRFINSLKVSATFTLVEVPLQLITGLLFAALLTENSLFNKTIRALYFLPIICSATVIGIVWQLILNPNIGMIPYWLTEIGFPKLQFFRNPDLALPSIMFMSVWRSIGINVTILVAAMHTVPKSLYEAATMDGANRIRMFWNITLPVIRPTIWFVLITRVIDSLQVFDLIYTVTGGGPKFSTETVVAYVYNRAFSADGQLGYASAMAEILFFIILIVAIILYSFMVKQEKS